MIQEKTRCERFENEALLLLEQGQPLDEHFSSCPDCLEARAAYDRLRERLSSLGKEDEPAPGWQARVWEKIEQRKERRRRWSPWWIAPAGITALAAMAALFLLWIPGRTPAGLRIEIEAGTTVRRGAEAQPGDLLKLAATTGGARHGELRVYRNDTELVLRCSTAPPCSLWRGKLTASVVLDGAGRYQPLLLLSKDPLPDVASDLDTDTDAALTAGADVELGPRVVVR
ncbi:MAG: anti-sigma factor family protein [Thermoanaerobaculia bacterium]